ncbi:MAG: transglutaminase domain-containing protein, partial [Spirochaetales bacterium]|nr:transglutaminase domain-containing protein [Spirochaetales bacterium]
MKTGNRELTLLFITRLLVHFAVFSLPLIHPGISVAYDRAGLILWFGLVPAMALLAFLPGGLRGLSFRAAPLPPGRGTSRVKSNLRVILAGGFLAAGVFFASGFNPNALPVLGIGCLSFVLTYLLFHFPRWGKIAVFEQIFFALISFRMLGFSRSSEEVAAESSALTQGILIFTLAAFLLHGMVIYYSLYRGPAAGGKRPREFAVFTLSAVCSVILLIALLPSDFVKNSVISNLLQDKVEPQPVPLDEEGDGMPDGNLRSDRKRGRNLLPRGGADAGREGANRLEGLPESQWPGQGQGLGRQDEDGDSQGEGERQGGKGKGKGQSKQYAVMIVAAKTDPVYAAGSYRGELHPLRGFLPSQNEILNSLPTMRLLETWFDFSYDYEEGRSEEEVFFFSTLPEKYLPYRPLAVEPTVLQRGYGPFRYSHRVRSRISLTGPQDWQQSRELDPFEKEEYAQFLDAALAKNDLTIFEAHLRGALETAPAGDADSEGPLVRILAILKSFEAFQYNAGYTDDTSIPALVDFLTYTKEGDCTEFSNTAAILGRLAGIPSRVVTGFLAS